MNKKILIIGGNSGIGLSMVKKMKSEGYDVYVCDKDNYNLNNQTTYYSVDLSYIDEVIEFTSYLDDKLDIYDMVYCAGFQDEIDLFELTVSEWNKMFNVHVLSAFLISKVIAKKMLSQNIPGILVYVSSIHGDIIREIANYSSTKAAQNMLMKEFAFKISPCGGRAFSIAPGSIDTPLLHKSLKTKEEIKESAQLIPLKRHGTADEIANSIYKLMQIDYLTGTVVTVDGGLSLII